jgi:hypothetical protein
MRIVRAVRYQFPTCTDQARRDRGRAARCTGTTAAITAGTDGVVHGFAANVESQGLDSSAVKEAFYDPPPPNDGCVHDKWKKAGGNAWPSGRGTGKFNPDHTQPASLGGSLEGIAGLKWAEARVNMTVGPSMKPFDPEKHGSMTASKCCD